ncbi:MAG: LysR substrate-binding domain-containing protein [Paracoccus sp. (in: a-proteobacteria)]|nr:LysR substrate-binding domain-containing protein [Paracoccus sp. (in: a-proteobacteria)]
MIDLRQLRYFVAIVEQGSFSRAANFLHVAQPALSLHVRNMEADLGTPLLYRTPRGVNPTEAGMILLRHARIIIDQLIVAEEEVRDHQNDPSGEVRLGVPGTIGQIIAVPLITAVHLRYPKIKLRIADAMSGFILEWMREERIDLAMLYAQADEHGIHTEHLLEEVLHFFGPVNPIGDEILPPPGQPVPFADLIRMPLILPGHGHGLRELLDGYANTAEITLDSAVDVDSYGNIKLLVEEGIGYSILPQHAIAAEVAQGRVRSWTVSDPVIQRSIYLAHSASRPMTNANTVVLNILRETVRDLIRTGRWIGAHLIGDS